MHDVLLILGSARSDGYTAAAADVLRQKLDLTEQQVVDLHLCNIHSFDYHAPMVRDDFGIVVTRLLAHTQLVFTTPVYWYAMSALMKTFFDRLTDLLLQSDSRPLGRALAGRNVWLLATGTDETLPNGFTVPFEKTASYFSMCWKEAFYVKINDDLPPKAQDLGAALELAAALARIGQQ